MDRPVIVAAREPESFGRIVHYESALRDWFRVYPGWHLERTREMMRLVRTPSTLSESAGMDGLSDPKDYLLFTLVLYFAESVAMRGGIVAGAGTRFLMSLMAEELVTLVQSRYGAGVLDFGKIDHRRSLMRAMQALERLGAIVRLEGSAGEWADRSASSDGLYAFTDVIYHITAGPGAHAVTELLEGLPEHPLRQPAFTEATDPDQRAWRALLLGPALLAVDDPEAFAIVQAKHSFFSRELHDCFEWRLDLRQGMARILRDTHAQDAGAVLISARLRADWGPILLFCNHLRNLVTGDVLQPDEHGGIRMAYSQFCTTIVDIRDAHRDIWAGGLSTCSPTELIERVLSVMRRGGLLRGPDSRLDVYLTPLCGLYEGIFAPEEQQPSDEEGRSDGQLRFFA